MPKLDSPEKLKEKCAEQKAYRANKNPVGRPKGGNLLVKGFNDVVASGDVDEAYRALLKVAKDTEHKHFAAAMKMLLERTAHTSNFEKAGSSSTPQININIGTTEKEVSIDGEVVSDTTDD